MARLIPILSVSDRASLFSLRPIRIDVTEALAARVAVAVLLFVSALLKGYEGFVAVEYGQIFPLGTSLVVVVFTAAVAAWLITTRNDRFGYGVIAIVFGLFCGYSVFKMAGGAASCGCFGLIHTSPLLMAGGDGLIAASAALLTRNAGRPAALMYVKTAMFVAGVIVITFAFAEGTVVSLSPTKGGSEWIRSVETVESFDGSWELVVVWHGCDKCSRFIDSLGPKGKFRRMLVEMEPYADDPATLIEQSHADAYGRLPLSSGLPLTFAPSRTLVRDATIIH